MSNSKSSGAEVQLVLKATRNSFMFKFSTNKENLYINNLSQNINYGWENPHANGGVKTTQLGFFIDKTTHDVVLNGFIYINANLGSGIDNFTKFKNICSLGGYWYLIDSKGNKLKGSGLGIWYVKSISQQSSDFISGMNALKISFSITINKYM